MEIDTTVSFKHNNKKYVVSLNLPFLKSRSRHFVFRHRAQIEQFVKITIDQKIIDKSLNNNFSSIEFPFKDRQYILIFSVKEVHNSNKAHTLITLEYFISSAKKNNVAYAKLIPEKNRYKMDSFEIPYFITVRADDMYVNTFIVNKLKVKAYVSNFIRKNNEWFLEKYNIENVMQRIASVLIYLDRDNPDISFSQFVSTPPFWLYANDYKGNCNYYNRVKYDTFLFCISITKKKENGESVHTLLLDSVHKNFTKDKIKQIEKKRTEKIYDFNLEIKEKPSINKSKRNFKRTGLRIIKKYHQERAIS